MPFFISKAALSKKERKAESKGYCKGRADGYEAAHGVASIIDRSKQLDLARDLVRLVPGVKEYVSERTGKPIFLEAKIKADIADLDAHEAAQRGQAIVLRIQADTEAFEKALKKAVK